MFISHGEAFSLGLSSSLSILKAWREKVGVCVYMCVTERDRERERGRGQIEVIYLLTPPHPQYSPSQSFAASISKQH